MAQMRRVSTPSVAETGAKGRRARRAKGRRSTANVGYKVGYKVFAVVVYQALIHGQQLSSTQPAAALGSSLVMRQVAASVGGQPAVLRASAGVRQGGERASGRATAATTGLRARWGQGRKVGFWRVGGLPPVGAIWGLADCGGRRFGRRRAFPARAVAPRPSFSAGGGGGSQNTPLLLKQMRLGVGNFSQKSGIGKFRNSEIRNPRVEKTAMENVRENKKTPPF